jgi:Sulfotransferase family
VWERRLDAFEQRVLWIFASPRSGTTWLLNLLGSWEGVATIDEPGIGTHLGVLASDALGTRPSSIPVEKLPVFTARAESPHYFFAKRYEDVWRPQLRRLVLDRLRAQAGKAALCVVKEPNGSQAAELLLSLLPRSRALSVLRDPRDVLDSQLDAAGRDSWLDRGFGGGRELTAVERLAYLEDGAQRWLQRTLSIESGFAQHQPDLCRQVRYEDLLADTAKELRPIVEWLGLSASRELIDAAVEKLRFDSLPAEQRGPGQFARAATPGLWRENMSADEQRAIDCIAGPKITELGYPAGTPV